MKISSSTFFLFVTDKHQHELQSIMTRDQKGKSLVILFAIITACVAVASYPHKFSGLLIFCAVVILITAWCSIDEESKSDLLGLEENIKRDFHAPITFDGINDMPFAPCLYSIRRHKEDPTRHSIVIVTQDEQVKFKGVLREYIWTFYEHDEAKGEWKEIREPKRISRHKKLHTTIMQITEMFYPTHMSAY